MDSFESRLFSASQFRDQLVAQSITQSFEQAIALWEAGYSMRIIQEVTGVHRSELSRYVNENNFEYDDNKNTQDRKHRVYQCKKLHMMGFSREEIAFEMNIHLRTVDSYFRELGFKDKSVFGRD